MKLFANGLSNDKDLAILKDNEKFNKDVSVDDITTSNATKKANEAKASNAFAVPINSAAEEEQARQCLRHLWLYERRMDKGLFCALGFIIILCLVGMATSIGGALYLKFRSQPVANATPTHIAAESAGLLGDDNLIDGIKANTDDAEGMSGFRIRVNISLPALDNLASDATESETSATITPYEDTIWEEIRRRNGLDDGAMSSFGNNGKDKSEVSSTDSSTKVDEVEMTPSFTSVNKHRVLQQPPSFSDFMTFIRKTLRIPTIKIVRDSHE